MKNDKKFNGNSDNRNNRTQNFDLGMMSVNAGRDNKPEITKTDIILAGQQNAAKKGRA